MTDDELDEYFDQQTSRFLEFLKDEGYPENTWDGIIDWVLSGIDSYTRPV